MALSLVTLVCVVSLGWLGTVDGVSVVDLTHDFGEDTLYWPGNPPYNFTILYRGNNTQINRWYESNEFSTAEHGGTHVDAPAHLFQGGWHVQDIPVSRLLGPAVVLDVKEKAAANPDYMVTVEDVETWEKTHGRLPPKSIVLMNSGWGPRYPNASRVFNTPTPTEPSTFHFPGFHPNTSTFLATQRDVIALGVDTPSVDHGQSTRYDAHVNMFQHNVLSLENVASLDQVPPKGATVIIGLVKLVDGSGGPARIMALVGQGADIFGAGCTGGGGRPVGVGGVVPLFWLLAVVGVVVVGFLRG